MRLITSLIIHCSDTYADMDIGADTIREWHVVGNSWSDIGYHYVICRSGLVEKGRDDEVVGAHAKGMNKNSIGICMVGGKAKGNENPVNFTIAQWASLDHLVKALQDRYPDVEVIGHCDVPDSGKTCPNFNVKAWVGE